jgi:hypothetical protein
MLLQTTLNKKHYSFEVIPLSDFPNNRIYFFVQVVGGNSLLLEKPMPGGKWLKIKGESFTDELQHAICKTIDDTNAAELWKDIMPLDEFDD